MPTEAGLGHTHADADVRAAAAGAEPGLRGVLEGEGRVNRQAGVGAKVGASLPATTPKLTPNAPREFHIPIRTGSGLNERLHWSTRARKVKRERYAVGMLLNPHQRPTLPCVVHLTRQSPGNQLLDDDNLPGSLKAVRDEVARWLGVDDADARVQWTYGQATKAGAWGVVVKVWEVV